MKKSKKTSAKSGLSTLVFKQSVKNPFVRTKAKNDPNHVIANDFLPTTSFWDLFSTTNQIVIGGRGTGKTMLMRMLCPSVFKNRPDIIDYQNQQDTYYVGFWVPFELRWITQITDNLEAYKAAGFSQNDIFEIVFNSRALCSLCREIDELIDVIFNADRIRAAEKKRGILQYLLTIMGWDEPECVSLSQFRNVFGAKFLRARAVKFTDLHGLETMRAAFLEPCEELARFAGELLSSDIEATSIVWMACFDEGEYLGDGQLKIVNTIMRSEGVEMTIKMTTLPAHYETFHTLKEDSPVKSGGHDFSFVHIDFEGSSTEYKSLCDDLVSRRLLSLQLFRGFKEENLTLRHFLGSSNNKSLTELYEDHFCNDRIPLFSEVTRLLHERSRKKNYEPHKKAVQRYIPIVAYKFLEKKLEKGNFDGVTESGADRLKQLSEGNIREFLRIMAQLFTHARLEGDGSMGQTIQHKVVHKYLNLRVAEALGIESVGLDLEELLRRLRDDCRQYFYSSILSEGGCKFMARFYADEFPNIVRILKQGVAAGYFLLDEETAEHPITEDTMVRISASLLAHYRVSPRRNRLRIKSEIPTYDPQGSLLPLFRYEGGIVTTDRLTDDH